MNSKERSERVFDAMLTIALEDFLDKEIESVKAAIADMPEPEYSKRHIRRMKSLASKAKRAPNWAMRQFKRVAVVLLMISTVMFTSALSVEAVRDVIWAILATNNEERPVGIHKDSTPEPIAKPDFHPAYMLDGYTEIIGEEIMGGSTLVYRKEGAPDIAFHQYPKDSDRRYNIGNGKREYSQFDMNGVTVHVYKALTAGEKSFLIWEDGDYKFGLDATIDVDELIKIAESIK